MTVRPHLSIIVPTVGRPSLERTLRSLTAQRPHRLHYEVILVGDTHAGTWAAQLPFARALVDSEWYPHVRYVECDGGQHAWGHPQRNAGVAHARGHYLAWLGDDDIYLPDAFAAIHGAVCRWDERASDHPVWQLRDDPRVFLFRWIAPWKSVLWHTAGYLGHEPGHIDAACIVCPNDPEKLGTWTSRYQGDFDMITETIALHGGLERVIWQPEVIAQAQPTDAEDWTLGGREHPPARCRTTVLTVLVPVPVPVPAGVPA